MASADTEKRTLPIDVSANNTVTGYTALFNSKALIAGEFVEQISPGAFARSLATRDVVALHSHDYGRVLGRMSNGALRLREDRRGLQFELDLDPTTPDGQSAIGQIRRRDIKGCSIGFLVTGESWTFEDGDLPLRTITDVVLVEVTLTAFPAYESTTVALRSLASNRAAEILRRKLELDFRVRGLRL